MEYDVFPDGSVVIPVGGSRWLSVRFIEEAVFRSIQRYSGCPPMSLELFRWSISDQNVARVEPHRGAVVTITGLAVGETEIVVQHSPNDVFYRVVRLTVVAPSGDAHGASPNLAEPGQPATIAPMAKQRGHRSAKGRAE